jgi:iron complex transport system permease protein
VNDSQVQTTDFCVGHEKFEEAHSKPMTTFQDRRKRITLFGLLWFLLLVTIISLSTGAVPMTAGQTIAILGNSLGLNLPWEYTLSQQAVFETIRAPRVILAILVGSVLAVSGAAMQGLFRNPLADPALIGISSGATLAAVAVIVLEATVLQGFSRWTGAYSLPIAAFAGGFAATWLVYHFATIGGRPDISSLLLAGIAINALAGSATGLLIYLADNDQLRTITFWTMGSLSGASWSQISVGAPFFLGTLICLPFVSRALNAMLLGEAEAGHLGFSVEKIKTLTIFLVALGVGATVSFAGIIGFVGLVVPHLLRLWFGPDHRSLLPCAAILGAILLLAADLLARTIVIPAEMPIGIITGILGGPFFLWLLRRQRMIGGF